MAIVLAAVAVVALAWWGSGAPGWSAVARLVSPAGTTAGAPSPRAGAAAPLGVPAPVPPGPGGHSFTMVQADGATPVTWDPCRPVHLVVNDANRPPGAHELVAEAVAELRRATGLALVLEGATDEAPPGGDRASFQPDRYGDRWAPVLVAWSDPAEHPALAGAVTGVGGGVAYAADGELLTYVSGTMVLDGPQLHEIGRHPGGYARVRAVLLHELAHVLGLGHVDDPTHLMHPSATAATGFHPGDLAGLAALGRGPCVPSL